jgi:GTPase Era involved in 16S rRNA processing
VLTRDDAQVVFVDTPGIHKPRTPLGERLNVAAESTIGDMDVVVFVIDATQPLGRGDRWVSERVPRDAVVVVNKVDVARPEEVRAQLLAVARDELPHSIATRVTEWEWPVIRCEILVERESQKGIVIGHRGSVLKAVGTAVRAQLPEGAYLELHVKVDKDWQRHASALDRLGF